MGIVKRKWLREIWFVNETSDWMVSRKAKKTMRLGWGIFNGSPLWASQWNEELQESWPRVFISHPLNAK